MLRAEGLCYRIDGTHEKPDAEVNHWVGGISNEANRQVDDFEHARWVKLTNAGGSRIRTSFEMLTGLRTTRSATVLPTVKGTHIVNPMVVSKTNMTSAA